MIHEIHYKHRSTSGRWSYLSTFSAVCFGDASKGCLDFLLILGDLVLILVLEKGKLWETRGTQLVHSYRRFVYESLYKWDCGAVETGQICANNGMRPSRVSRSLVPKFLEGFDKNFHYVFNKANNRFGINIINGFCYILRVWRLQSDFRRPRSKYRKNFTRTLAVVFWTDSFAASNLPWSLWNLREIYSGVKCSQIRTRSSVKLFGSAFSTAVLRSVPVVLSSLRSSMTVLISVVCAATKAARAKRMRNLSCMMR